MQCKYIYSHHTLITEDGGNLKHFVILSEDDIARSCTVKLKFNCINFFTVTLFRLI
jgi:hypothetical protein